jgi:hypothetical protein
MCLCTSGFKPDEKDPNRCVEEKEPTPADDSYYNIPISRMRRRKTIFSTMAVMVLLGLVVGSVYYYWHTKNKPRYATAVQFENPAFDS